MAEHDLRRSHFEQPRIHLITFLLDYSGAWSGRCVEPEAWACEVAGQSAEQTCDAAWERVAAQFGPDSGVHYRYTDAGWAQACAEDAENPEAQATRLACPLCNEHHPDHEAAVKAAHAPLN